MRIMFVSGVEKKTNHPLSKKNHRNSDEKPKIQSDQLLILPSSKMFKRPPFLVAFYISQISIDHTSVASTQHLSSPSEAIMPR